MYIVSMLLLYVDCRLFTSTLTIIQQYTYIYPLPYILHLPTNTRNKRDIYMYIQYIHTYVRSKRNARGLLIRALHARHKRKF